MHKAKTKSSRKGGFTKRRKPSKVSKAKFDKAQEPKTPYEVTGDAYVIWRDDSSYGESFQSAVAVCDTHEEALKVMRAFAEEEAKADNLVIENGWSEDSLRLAANDRYVLILMDVREVSRFRMRKDHNNK